MNDDRTADPRFPVAVLWHMHQPEYRVDGRFHLPWVYLHAIGAYSDMAAHLEAVEGACAVVNFSPVLLDQIQDYAQRMAADRDYGKPFGDALLDCLRQLPPPGAERAGIVRRCMPIHRNRRTDRHPEYLAMVEQVRQHAPEALPDELLTGLVLWFHMGWLGESLRGDARVVGLLGKGAAFDAIDCWMLLDLIADTLAGLLPRYRRLAEAGRAELSMTPYYHPLLPLLLDFHSAQDNAPGVTVPETPYPGGAARARWHLVEGRRRFTEIFGRAPTGCWPSEAALSDDTLALLDELGFTWTASSRSVLAGTLHHHGWGEADPFHPWRRDGQALHAYFRDDGISDRIGFAYKDWHAPDAVSDLTQTLEHIASDGGRDLVFIALDGENPWEYFAENGQHFVRGLYQRLASHPRLRLATLAQCSAKPDVRVRPLPALRAGSWVHGQLLTWVGHSEKNRAWDLLMQARSRYVAHPNPSPRALAAMGACEGSDWFWWPGATNPSDSVSDFDSLLRAHLSSLYRALGEAPPKILSRPFAAGVEGPVAAGGTMKPTAPVTAPWTPRSAGVLLDIHALPSASLAHDAVHFARLAADAGLSVWQILPIGPRDSYGNPFQPSSAFAGDTSLVGDELDDVPEAFESFCQREQDWLDDWSLFVALKHEFLGAPWWQWPADLRDRTPMGMATARARLAGVVEREQRMQYRFDREWSQLKRAANAMGLQLFGDVPLFVAHDSADVWAHRDLFELDAQGQCEATVGVPPDAFSDEGQWWGFPAYRWSAMAQEGFRWWKRRFEVQASRFDLVRLDHFRGLAAWWRIPGDAASAADGAWIPGPSAAAIEAIRPGLRGARLVAEDLGVITDDVIALRKEQGIPGMRVLQFAFDSDLDNPHLPQHHEPDTVCYTGTHDNDTTLGWWTSLAEATREKVFDLLGSEARNMPQALLEWAWASPAPLSIAPFQDLLGLGTEARTNVPGLAAGNWRWKFSWPDVPADFAPRLRETLHRHGRVRPSESHPTM
ncbi:MAG: 4-alpha-glucanotransferase [Panacagrimonas sp.]